MAQLIAQTQENVQTAQNQLQDFTDTCNSEIKKFLDASVRDDQNFYTVSKEKDVFATELNKIYYELDRAAANFSVYYIVLYCMCVPSSIFVGDGSPVPAVECNVYGSVSAHP